jgi:methyl-accepting chemotaxis protein
VPTRKCWGGNEITSHVKKVSAVMAEIAAVSEPQNEGVTQINKAIDQMNQITPAVAANAEESASGAEEMTSQSTEMLMKPASLLCA